MDNKKNIYEEELHLIEGLKNNEATAFEYVYRQYYKMTAQYVGTNKGSKDDAQDVFQEALIVLVKNLRNKDFKLTAKVSTYLFAIAKKYWLYKLRGNRDSSVEIENLNTDHLIENGEDLLTENEYDVKHSIIGEVFHLMKEDCKELLTQYYFNKSALGEIAKKMGWSDDFVKVKKRRCMEALKNLVQQHSSYQLLIN
jgi:RNA polymerase sigma factor (sigma-70 family)